MVYQTGGEVKNAYAAYERAIRVDPGQVIAYNNLAWLAATRQERLDEALTWIKKANSLAPKGAPIYDTYGWVLRARGDLAGAAKILKEGIALEPSADLHYHLGVVQTESGVAAEAQDNFRQALKIAPNFDGANDAKQRLGLAK